MQQRSEEPQLLDASPEELFVQQTAYEIAHQPGHEREGQRDLVDQMLGETFQDDLVERQRLLEIFDASIRRARGEVARPRHELYPFTIPAGKIDWISKGQEQTVEVETVHTPGITYGFVDLTAQNAATRKAANKLAVQTTTNGERILPKLQGMLKTQLIPRLYDDILHGGSSRRPLSRQGNESGNRAATDYPVYKLGVQGTSNRAIVLILNGGEKPVIALAALYDHDDDLSVLRAIA